MVNLSYFSVLNLLALAMQLFMSSVLGLLMTLLMLGAYLYLGIAYGPVAMPPAAVPPQRVAPEAAPAIPAPAEPAPAREGRAPMPPQPAGMV